MHFDGKWSEITKYYFAGASRIAIPQGDTLRKYTVPVSMELEYFLSDHLGSTSITTDNTGAKVSEMRYTPWGEVRFSWTSAMPSYTLGAYTFTGQYSYMDDPSTSGVTEGFGLMFYNARWYDPSLGRFAQADTIVPGGVQGLDRYAYVNNSPVMYIDPSGHYTQCQAIYCSPIYTGSTVGTSGKSEPELTEAGEKMKKLYDYYASNPSGEWNSNGGEFTPADFLAWMLMIESSGDVVLLEYIMETAGRQLWGNGVDSNGDPSHSAYCPSNPCTNGVFNYLGKYSGSAMGRYNSLQSGDLDSVTQNPNNYDDLLAAGFTVERVGRDVVINPLWTTYNNDLPVHFGNYLPGIFGPPWVANMCPDTPMFTNSRNGIVYKFKDQNDRYVVVYTPNQERHWSSPGKKC